MATAQISVGARFGPYRIEAVVGRGGMGVVYRAVDERLQRAVALKIVSPELAENPQLRERFLRESRAAASIDHPGVLPVYEAGEIGGVLFIAMRFVPGEDLSALLQREGPLDPVRAVALVAQVAEALDAVHDHGLVHRDIKPGNILVAADGTRVHCYLTDFGISKLPVDDAPLTGTGTFLGTLDYAAPEVFRGEPADARADVYSLGCLLYQCVTGEVPFPRASDAGRIYAHLEEDPPDASEHEAAVPRALAAAIVGALAKDPAARFQTAGEFADAASEAVGGSATTRVRTRRRRGIRRRHALLAAALLAVAAVAAVVLAPGGGGKSPATVDADAVALIDPGKHSLVAEIPVGRSPAHMAEGAGAVWVTNADAQTVSRIDPATRAVVQTIRVGASPSAIVVAGGGVWVANGGSGSVSRISPETNEVVRTLPVGNGPTGLCATGNLLWVGLADDRTVKVLDATTGRVKRTIPVGDAPTELACGPGSVWVTAEASGTVSQIDAGTGSVVHRINVGAGPSGVSVDRDAVWVANTLDGTVSRIDAGTGGITATIPIARNGAPSDVAIAGDALWVSDEATGTLSRLDAKRDAVAQRIQLGGSPTSVAQVDGKLWVGVRDSGAQHRGGTLRVLAETSRATPWDPAVTYGATWQSIMSVTYDGLTAYRRADGREGTAVVPDLAVAIPVPVDGGRTYAFRLRPGLRYSTGVPVKASDVRRGIARGVADGDSPARGMYSSIEGVTRCAERGKGCDLARGITTDDASGSVVFHLAEPDPELPLKLALTFAAPAPPGTPAPNDGVFVPGTGPYAIEQGDGPVMRLVRNRYFRSWSAAARPTGNPDAITIRWDTAQGPGVAAVRSGRADYYAGGPLDPSLISDLRAQYPARVHEQVQPVTLFYWLNTRRPPFDRLAVRRAVNLAIDRAAAVDRQVGDGRAQPTCQILPPNFPGYRPYCPYGGVGGHWHAPDLARARQLVAASGTRGARVTVTLFQEAPSADVLVRALRMIGYRARVRHVSPQANSRAAEPDTHMQVGEFNWLADYPAASNFLETFFGCAAPGDLSTLNYSHFCDRTMQRLIGRARRLEATDPGAADALWAQADRRVVDQAAAVPLFNQKSFDFFSARVGGYRGHPMWGVLLDQLWVQSART